MGSLATRPLQCPHGPRLRRPESERRRRRGPGPAAFRRAFIAYARWLDSISWKRFFLLSVLALIASGILSALPPFNIEWGGTRKPTAADKRAKAAARAAAKAKAPVTVQGTDERGGYEINIGKNGVQITRSKRRIGGSERGGTVVRGQRWSLGGGAVAARATGAGAAVAAATRRPARATGSASSCRRASTPRRSGARSRRRRKSSRRPCARATERSRYEPGFILGDHLPPFTVLLIVLSIVTKIMAAGRFKAEAKAVVATEIAESEALKRQVVEARMAAMQAQVEPHFLFNTLASIDHLIETDPKRASQMQKNLIALLRASMPAMREAHPTAHNLGREMAVIRPYLEILKVRMEDRLQIDVAVPEGLLSAEFPSMMIQSLVENAIKHGLEPKAEGGTLTVRAEIVHGKLAVTVADTGLGFGKAATAGTGTGLANIRERLKLLYGNRASMSVSREPTDRHRRHVDRPVPGPGPRRRTRMKRLLKTLFAIVTIGLLLSVVGIAAIVAHRRRSARPCRRLDQRPRGRAVRACSGNLPALALVGLVMAVVLVVVVPFALVVPLLVVGIGLALGVLAIVATTTLLLSPLLLIGWLIWRLARPARPVRVSAA